MDALAIAAHLLSECAERRHEVAHFKLQKLLYYAQGTALGLYRRPLFDDLIEAWEQGPVVPSVYRAYGAHGREQIPVPPPCDAELDPWAAGILSRVIERYGWMTPWALRQQLHLEQPWWEAWRSPDPCAEIRHETMRECFAAQSLCESPARAPKIREEVLDRVRANPELAALITERTGVPLL